jgi:hypothetical protein
MCCGQKRSAIRNASSQATTPTARPRGIEQPQPSTIPQTAAVKPPEVSVSVRYMDNPAIKVRGPVTGRQYEFSGLRPVQVVDPRDAAALLRTRFFRQS